MQKQQLSDYEGILLIDKEAGCTSHDVVDKARRILKMRSIGHAGTLDPNATGLLVLLVGKATKASQYLMSLDKTYEGRVRARGGDRLARLRRRGSRRVARPRRADGRIPCGNTWRAFSATNTRPRRCFPRKKSAESRSTSLRARGRRWRASRASSGFRASSFCRGTGRREVRALMQQRHVCAHALPRPRQAHRAAVRA